MTAEQFLILKELAAEVPGSGRAGEAVTRQCAWCSRILDQGLWWERVPSGPVSHGICPRCSRQMLAGREIAAAAV